MSKSNEICMQIWKDRYCKNNETYDDNLKRVADFVCKNDTNFTSDLYDMMKNKLFFPAGRTMSNAGLGKEKLTLNNCFTLNFIPDDMGGIFERVKSGALVHKSGGGSGYECSVIRPNGTPTNNDAIASGVVSFLKVFDAQTATVNQGSRRGANMGVLSIYHPDIVEFVTAKSKDENMLKHFNLSVMVDDEFMKAKENNQEIYLHYPVYDETGKIIKDESKWQIKRKINAAELWNQIMELAYNNGEPGVLFYDNMNRLSPTNYMENIICTNPCGEYVSGVLYGDKIENSDDYWGACNLGSLFLHNFVKEPFTKNAKIDWSLLENAIYNGVRALDNIIDINYYPLKQFENYQKNMRVIGMGITGLGDAMTMLNIIYGSDESVKFTEQLMNFIVKNQFRTSIALAKEKGSFTFLDKEKYANSEFISSMIEYDKEWQNIKEDILKYGIRNARHTSIAPTGTLSMAFGNNCSSGLEPIFSLEYDRKVKIGGQDDKDIQIVKFRDYAYDLWLETEKDNIVDKSVFVTAMDMPVESHTKILCAITKFTNMAISKTINIPEDYSFEDTKEVYDYCYKNGAKGCTIFRPNSVRQGILINPSAEQPKETIKEKNDEFTSDTLPRGFIIEPDTTAIGKKRKLMTGCGSLHVTAFFDPDTGDLLETFLTKGSTGGCNNFMVGLSRMISLAARAGVNIDAIVDQLNSSGACPSYAVRTATKRDTSKGSCCPVAIGNALIDMYKEIKSEIDGDDEEEDYEEVNMIAYPEGEKTIMATVKMKDGKTTCPECGEKMIIEGGCNSCKSCGYSKCG